MTSLSAAAAPSRTIRFYSALEFASEEMLDAARAGDWGTVCRLEAACSVIIARLRTLGPHEALQAHEQDERVRILRSILANDAEIRRLAQPGEHLAEGAATGAVAAWPAISTTLH